MTKNKQFTVFEVALLYLILGLAWVILNDYLLATYGQTAHYISKISAIIFVLFSAFVFYFFFDRFIHIQNDLRAERSNINAIINNTTEIVVMVDKNRRIIKFNKLFENYIMAYFNTKPQYGQSYLDYTSQTDIELLNARIERVLRGENVVFERQFTVNKMPTLWLVVNYKPVPDAFGNINQFVVNIQDITLNKLAELEVQRAKVKFETIFNESYDGILVLDATQHTIIECNQKAIELLQISTLHGVNGKKINDFFQASDNLEKLEQYLKNVWELNVTTPEIELELVFLNTELHWLSIHACKSQIGADAVMLVWLRNINERKQKQIELTTSETKFRELANSSPVMMWTADTNGRINFYNKSWLDFTGWQTDELSGNGWNNSIHPEDQDYFENKIYYPSIRKRQPYEAEFRIKRYDGSYRWLYERGVPKYNANGDFEGFTGSDIDITVLKKAELKLKESEAKFKELANSSPVMIWTADIEGRITFYNNAWLQFTGQSFDEQIGDGWIASVHPDDLEGFIKNIYNKSIKEQSAYGAEFRLRHHSGQYKWVFERGLPKFNEEGLFEGFYGSTIDITDRKVAELELLQSQQLLTRITTLSPDIIYLHDITKQKNVFTNRNMAEILGYDPVLCPDMDEKLFEQIIHPDDRAEVLYGSHFFSKLQHNTYVTSKYRIKNAAGNWRWYESIDTIFQTSADGNPTQILGYARDITDAKVAEELLQDEKQFNSAIVNTSPTLIYIFNLQTQKITFANQRFYDLTGYTPAEVLAMESSFIEKMILPDDQHIIFDLVKTVLEHNNDEILEFQIRIRHKNGQTIWLLLNTKVFKRDAHGMPELKLGTGRDISERKSYEEMLLRTNNELKVANEELDSFVYRASHDLRSPLASVMGLINLLNAETHNSIESQYLELMKRSISKLMEVIEDLINHSKNARLELIREKIDLEVLLWEVVNDLRYMDHAEHIEFKVEVIQNSEFYSDRMRLLLAFNNLISNAIKYHKKEPKEGLFVKITIEISPEVAKIVISDNGMGIEAKHLDKIFNMFYRAHKDSNGSGLGLYIVKGIFEKLHGTIHVSSVTNQGTKFELQVPNLYTSNAHLVRV